MSAVLESLNVVEPVKREAQPQQVKIDPTTTLFQPWALKAMSIMRVQEAWRVSHETLL